MTAFIPVVGEDENGVALNTIINGNGVHTTSDPRIVDGPSASTIYPTFTLTEITALFKSADGTFATGYGLVNNSTSTELVWKKDGLTWSPYKITKGALRSIGLGINAGKYLVSYGTGLGYTTLTPTGASWPATTFNENPVDFRYTGPNSIDNLVSGTFVVGGSLSTIGSFTPNTTISAGSVWDVNAGEARKKKTGHLSTSYTFPGYSGSNSQVQRQDAHTNSTPTNFPLPTDWNTHATPIEGETSGNQGYYGVNGASLKVTWPKA